MADNVHAISALSVVNLDLLRMKDSDHDDLAARACFHRNRPILIGDRDHRPGTHSKAEFFSKLGRGANRRCQNHESDKLYALRSRHSFASHSVVTPATMSLPLCCLSYILPRAYRRLGQGTVQSHLM